MPRRKSLLGTLVPLVAALMGQPLSPLAEAAPMSARPAATTDAVPRLVRTARLEADMPASCHPPVTATLSADGHTAILGCVLWGSEYASTKRAWAVLSDAFPDGRWRIVGRFEAYGRVDVSADGRTIATGDYTYRDVRIYAPKDGTWRETAVVDPGSAYRCCDSFDLSDDGATIALGLHSRVRNREEVDVYRRTSTGWSLQVIVHSPFPNGYAFGSLVRLSARGDALVAGSYYTSPLLYRRFGSEYRLTTPLPGAEVSNDMARVAVRQRDGVTVYDARDSDGWRTYVRTARFAVADAGVVLSRDGRTLLLTNPRRTLHDAPNAGRIHRFVASGTGWRFGGVLDPRKGVTGYGSRVTMDAKGRRVLVGLDSPQGSASGEVMTADLYQQPAAR